MAALMKRMLEMPWKMTCSIKAMKGGTTARKKTLTHMPSN